MSQGKAGFDGSIWLFRVIISLVLGIRLWLPARTSGRRSFLQATLALLSVMELVSLAGVGHAAAGPDPFGASPPFRRRTPSAYLGVLAGTLAPLAAFLLLLLKSSQVEAIVLAAPVVRRFSASSLIAVAGMEGALFSVLAGLVWAPVIAVPTSVGYGVAEGGKAALHAALASCAPGLVVVNVDNGFGAAAAALKMRFCRQIPGGYGSA